MTSSCAPVSPIRTSCGQSPIRSPGRGGWRRAGSSEGAPLSERLDGMGQAPDPLDQFLMDAARLVYHLGTRLAHEIGVLELAGVRFALLRQLVNLAQEPALLDRKCVV